MTDALVLPRVVQQRGLIAGEMLALVEGAQRRSRGDERRNVRPLIRTTQPGFLCVKHLHSEGGRAQLSAAPQLIVMQPFHQNATNNNFSFTVVERRCRWISTK